MSDPQKRHLQQAQIIRAVVDAHDLSVSDRRHLNTCHQCRTQKSQLEKNLARLERNARQHTPLPHQRLKMTTSEKSHTIRLSWNWKTVPATALAFAIFLVSMWWAGQGGDMPEPSGSETIAATDVKTSESQMTQARLLSENALPPEYLDIAVETEPDINEEFINFVAPILEDDSLTFISKKRGIRLC